jgi:hypothetical protein
LIRSEVAALVVDGRPETGEKLRRRLLLEANPDYDSKLLLEPIRSLTSAAGLEVAPDLPGSERREFPIEITVDILEGVIAVLAHLDLLM